MSSTSPARPKRSSARRPGQRRRHRGVYQDLGPVLVHLRHRHRDRNHHRRASATCCWGSWGHSGPGSQNRTRNRRTRQRGTARTVIPAGSPHHRRPAHITLGNARCVRKRADTPISGIVQADIRTRSRPSKRRTPLQIAPSMILLKLLRIALWPRPTTCHASTRCPGALPIGSDVHSSHPAKSMSRSYVATSGP